MEIQDCNSVAVLTFAESADYPRLTRAVIAELADILATLEREPAFRGVVIAANSKSLATGAEVEEVTSLDGIWARDFARRGQALFDHISNFSKPVVAAIRGYCLSGGFDLALACHQRVATYDSSFGHPGVSLGLITGWSGTQRLPRLLGKSGALQILLTGERLPATQALTLGLVNELASSRDLIEAAARHANSPPIKVKG